MLALFLINARDGFRCVFWKGSSNSHRTPSMWLIPNDTRVTFRVCHSPAALVHFATLTPPDAG